MLLGAASIGHTDPVQPPPCPTLHPLAMLLVEVEWLSALRSLLLSISSTFIAHPAFLSREDSAHCQRSRRGGGGGRARGGGEAADVSSAPASSLDELLSAAVSSLHSLVEGWVEGRVRLLPAGAAVRNAGEGEVEGQCREEERRLCRCRLHAQLFSGWHCFSDFLTRPLFRSSITAQSTAGDGHVEAALESRLLAALSSPLCLPFAPPLHLPCYLYFALVGGCGLQGDMADTFALLPAQQRKECEGVAAVYEPVVRHHQQTHSRLLRAAALTADPSSPSPIPSPSFTLLISLASLLAAQPPLTGAQVEVGGRDGEWASSPFLLSLLPLSSQQSTWVTALSAIHRAQLQRDRYAGEEEGDEWEAAHSPCWCVYAEDLLAHGLVLDLLLCLLAVRRALGPIVDADHPSPPPPLPPSSAGFCADWLAWHDLGLSACRLLALRGDPQLMYIRASCFSQRVQDGDIFASEGVRRAADGAPQPHRSCSAPSSFPPSSGAPLSLSLTFLSCCVPCPLRCSASALPAVTSAFNRLTSRSCGDGREEAVADDEVGAEAEVEVWLDVVESSIRAPALLLSAAVQAATCSNRAHEMGALLHRLHPAAAAGTTSEASHLCSFRRSPSAPPLLCEALACLLFDPHLPSSPSSSCSLLFSPCYVPDFNPANAELLVAFLRCLLHLPPIRSVDSSESSAFPPPSQAGGSGEPTSSLPWCSVEWISGRAQAGVSLAEVASTALLPALSRPQDTARCTAALTALQHILCTYRSHRAAPPFSLSSFPSSASSPSSSQSSSLASSLTPGSFPAVFHFPFARLCVVLTALLQRRSQLSQAQVDGVVVLIGDAVELLSGACHFLLACGAAASAVLPRSSPLFAAALRAHAELTGLHCSLTRSHWSSQAAFYPLLNHALHALVVLQTPSTPLSVNLTIPLPSPLLVHMNRMLGSSYAPHLSAPWMTLVPASNDASEDPLHVTHHLCLLASASEQMRRIVVEAVASLLCQQPAEGATSLHWARAFPFSSTPPSPTGAESTPAPTGSACCPSLSPLFLRCLEASMGRIIGVAAADEAQRLLTSFIAQLLSLSMHQTEPQPQQQPSQPLQPTQPLPSSAPSRPPLTLSAFIDHLELLLHVGQLMQRMRRQERARFRAGREGKEGKEGQGGLAGSSSRGVGGGGPEWTSSRYARCVRHLLTAFAWLLTEVEGGGARVAAAAVALTAAASRALSSRAAAVHPASLDHPLHLHSLHLTAQLMDIDTDRGAAVAAEAAPSHRHVSLVRGLTSSLPRSSLMDCALCSACWMVDVAALPPPYASAMQRRGSRRQHPHPPQPSA